MAFNLIGRLLVKVSISDEPCWNKHSGKHINIEWQGITRIFFFIYTTNVINKKLFYLLCNNCSKDHSYCVSYGFSLFHIINETIQYIFIFEKKNYPSSLNCQGVTHLLIIHSFMSSDIINSNSCWDFCAFIAWVLMTVYVSIIFRYNFLADINEHYG